MVDNDRVDKAITELEKRMKALESDARRALWPLRNSGTFLARKWFSNSLRPGQDRRRPERPP